MDSLTNEGCGPPASLGVVRRVNNPSTENTKAAPQGAPSNNMSAPTNAPRLHQAASLTAPGAEKAASTGAPTQTKTKATPQGAPSNNMSAPTNAPRLHQAASLTAPGAEKAASTGAPTQTKTKAAPQGAPSNNMSAPTNAPRLHQAASLTAPCAEKAASTGAPTQTKTKAAPQGAPSNNMSAPTNAPRLHQAASLTAPSAEKAASTRVMERDCISRFFHNDAGTPKKSPLRIPASQNSDLDLSQNSIDEDMLSLSQLTIEEQEPLDIPAFFNITPREMPISPHCVMEEEFSANPWAMLIATIFLTKTRGKNARRFMKEFFQTYPTPYEVLEDNPSNLERFFDTLGLRKRGYTIWKLSYQFVSSKWRRASDLCGIGKYGEDAYRIFCLGHTDLDPGDRFLKLYLDWLVCHTEFLEDHGIVDSECVLEDPISRYYKITLR